MEKSNSAPSQTVSETISFRGHRNILGTHYNTLEITKEKEISKRADCIIGVSATKACSDISELLAAHIKAGGKMAFVIKVNESEFTFTGYGSSDLQLSDPSEMVLRKSNFASSRTFAIQCDASAIDLPRSLIKQLQDPLCSGELIVTAIAEYAKEKIPTLDLTQFS